MKKLVYIAPSIVLALFLWLVLSKREKHSNLLDGAQKQSATTSSHPMTDFTPVKPLRLPSPALRDKSRNIAIPDNMRRATDDPAVVQLVTSRSNVEIGELAKNEKGNHELWNGDRLVFEAKRIGFRSQANNGTIALDAVTGQQTPIEDAKIIKIGDKSTLISSPREVWIVSPSGNKTKVSPVNVDAFNPVIAPDGNGIAFTGRLLDNQGIPSVQKLYVRKASTESYQVFANDGHLDQYLVWPVDWVQNGTVVRVLQDYGETGGHMELLEVRVN